MEETDKIDFYKKCLTSKDNLILELDKDFLDLTGYRQSELLGKTLAEVGKKLRIDSQVDLQDIEDTTIFLFTKEDLPIEGVISYESIGNQKVFSFKINNNDSINEKFKLVTQFGTSRGDGTALLSFSSEISSVLLINSNQNFLDYLGAPYNRRSNSIGKKVIEITSVYSQEQINNIKDDIVDSSRPYYIKERYINSRTLGETYWNISLVPVLEEEIIKYVLLTISDVTEEVLNRKAIEQKNEELETVIDNISDEIVIFDKDANITIYNKIAKKNFGFKDPDLMNLNDFTKEFIIFDKDDKLVSDGNFAFQRIAKGESISDYVMKIDSPSGLTYREVCGSPIYDKSGAYNGGLIVYRDIDNRVEAEEARLIKAKNEILTTIVEALDLEYIRCTYPEFGIISINRNGFNSFKNARNGTKDIDCPLGENYFEIYPRYEEIKRKGLDLYLIEKGQDSYLDYSDHIVDGERRFFKTINQPIFGLNNNIVEMIFITIDITDEVKAKNKIEETLEMQNQMFATISHELKTPLSIIFSASQLIEIYLKKEIDKINKEDISKSVATIKQNGYRFTKLINNIIDLSSIEFGFYKLNTINKNVIAVVEDIVDSVRCYVEDKGLSIIFDTEVEEKTMAVDVDKMERILLNLISNAVKFSPKGGNIYIEIKDKDNFVEILIHDCGVGIKQSHLDTIFDKYKKLDSSLVRNAEGSGIGLSLVKKMIDLLEGEISVKSELGKGSIFTVRLPVKILDESENIRVIEKSGNIIEQINIEFSDIYDK